MVALPTLSDRANALVRTFQAALKALDDHKLHGERSQIYDLLAAHIRSASPMSFALPDPVLAPVDVNSVQVETHVRRDLEDGAGYDLRLDDGFLRLTFLDVTGDNAMHHFVRDRAKEFHEDFGRVLAAMVGGGR